jgi:putative membrane protein
MIARFAISLVLLSICSCVSEDRAVTADGKKSLLSATDRAFAQDAAKSNLAEIQLSQLAVDRASRDDVKKFARQMVEDHTKLSAELSKLADAKQTMLPGDLSPKHNQLKSRLAKQKGSEFDRQYTAAMVDDHVQAVTLFETQSRAGGDGELKSFAASNLAMLRQHLEEARALAAKADGAEK